MELLVFRIGRLCNILSIVFDSRDIPEIFPAYRIIRKDTRPQHFSILNPGLGCLLKGPGRWAGDCPEPSIRSISLSWKIGILDGGFLIVAQRPGYPG
jgi:hypothetical protein